MTYKSLFDNWKILFDYCCWVNGGGEALYGDVKVAEAWCAALMAAMTTMVAV